MIYKWLGPFNEMYIKMKEQHKKRPEEVIIMEMFEDLFGETFRTDSPLKKKRVSSFGVNRPYLSEGSAMEMEDYKERLNGE